MSHYDNLDNLIVNAIKQRRSPLYSREVSEEAELIADVMGREAFRVVDARLTALKKAGRIVHRTKLQAACDGTPGGWSVVAC